MTRRTKRRSVGSFAALTLTTVLAASFVGVAGTAGAGTAGSAVVRAGFTDTVFAQVKKPTALAVTPDGRMLVVDKAGRIWVIDDGAVVATPALDISAKVCGQGERGLLGVAVDPDFAANGHVFLYYTFKKFGNCDVDVADVPVNRVVRFTMVGNTIDPTSEKILIDDMVSFHGNHNAGDLGFGHDGMLYASVGDGACDYTGASGCGADNQTAQRTNTLQGKVLRITADGGIPVDNPFTGSGTARCNHGPIALGKTCREIYLYGLRNPFRFAFDPNANPTRMFVNDVGLGTWEEIDRAVKGRNYGWPVREGFCVTGSLTDCSHRPRAFTNPIFAYSHDATSCDAITEGAFVPDGAWGGAYDGAYFYGDYTCGEIFLIRRHGSGKWTVMQFASDLGQGGPIVMMFAPHGAATSLYYTTYAGHGEVHVIDLTT